MSSQTSNMLKIVEGVDITGRYDSEETPFILEEGAVVWSEFNIYHVEKVLGSGVYGQVARCRTEETGEIVALKIVNKKNKSAADIEATALDFLQQLDPDQTNIIRYMERFIFKDCFCFIFELLDLSLFDLMEGREWSPLCLEDIRSVTHQTLETLSALQSIGITHTDIKPDNIMTVDRYSEYFRVKMIDFGQAQETSQISEYDLMQADSYRAPEVHLGNPWDECVDMWGLGCSLAFLFLGRHLCPDGDYESLRFILKLLGQPDEYSLNTGWQVRRFFAQDQSGTESSWRLKTPEEFQQDTGEIVEKCHPIFDEIESLDDLLKMTANLQDPTEMEDLKSFVDLLKKMLALNPEDRIRPADALNHEFITKEHHAAVNNIPSVLGAQQITPGSECWFLNCKDEISQDKDSELIESRIDSEETPFILEEGEVVCSSSNLYHVEKVLGSGFFGQVVKCRTEGTGEIVALYAEDRIRPADALNHEFITKEHHAAVNNIPSLSEAQQTAHPGPSEIISSDEFSFNPHEQTPSTSFQQEHSINSQKNSAQLQTGTQRLSSKEISPHQILMMRIDENDEKPQNCTELSFGIVKGFFCDLYNLIMGC